MEKAEHPKFEFFKKGVIGTANGISYVSFVGMLVMVAVTVADILCRLIISQTIYGVYDWVCFMMVPVGFFAIARSTYGGGQVQVTVISQFFPRIVNHILDLINYLLMLGLVVIFTWKNIDQAGVVRMLGIKALQFPLKTFWFYYVIAFGYAVVCLVLVMMIIERILKWREPK